MAVRNQGRVPSMAYHEGQLCHVAEQRRGGLLGRDRLRDARQQPVVISHMCGEMLKDEAVPSRM